jgi:hypothetical protein
MLIVPPEWPPPELALVDELPFEVPPQAASASAAQVARASPANAFTWLLTTTAFLVGADPVGAR